LTSQSLLVLKAEANVSSGVGGVSGRAGGEVRGYTCFFGLRVAAGSTSKSSETGPRSDGGQGVIGIFWSLMECWWGGMCDFSSVGNGLSFLVVMRCG
jgi:hypothetical protein